MESRRGDALAPALSPPDDRFLDSRIAAEYAERVRWPDGRGCPHCGERVRPPYRLRVESATRRLWKCRVCRRQFTVTVGTMLESTHVPLDKWLLALHLLCSSPDGAGARELEQALAVSRRTARSMLDRVRAAFPASALAERAGEAVQGEESRIAVRLPFERALSMAFEARRALEPRKPEALS